MTRTIAAIASLFLLAGATSGPAYAVDWSGAGGNNNWGTAGNWVGGVAPPSTPATVITFGVAGTTFTPFANTPWTLGQLDITGATPYLLTGGVLTFGGSPAINISGAAHAIGNDLNFIGPVTFTTASDLTYSGSMSASAGLIKTGAGRLAVTNLNPFAAVGTITINGGTLRIGDGVTGPPGLGMPIVDNGTLEIAGSGVPSVSLPSGLTGTGNFVVSGGRADAFGTPLTHAGSTTVTGSALFVGKVNNNGPLVIGAGARMDAGDTIVGSLAGAGQLNLIGTSLTAGGNGTSTTYSGTITGGGAFVMAAPGRLALTNLNPFTGFFGTLTISGGTLQIGDGVTGPGAIPMLIVDNGTLEIAGSGLPSVALPSGLTGTGNFVVSGGRADAFGTPLTHAGSTTITGGAVFAGKVTNNGPLVIDAGARMDAANVTVGSLAGAGLLNIIAVGFTVGGDGTNTTFSGTIGGGTSLVKIGTGALTLSGLSAGGAGALVEDGALILTGSLSSVTVNVGGALGGSGTVIGPLVINDGGSLRVGIEGTTPGTQYDSLNVAGTVAVTESTLSLTGGYVPSVGDVFTIVTNDATDAVVGTFATLPEGGTLVFNGATLRISYLGGTGNDITLTAISTTARVWNGAGANNNWSTATNWAGGAAPPSASTTFVAFPAASARFGPVVDAPWTINRMNVGGASAYAISGAAITFTGTTSRLDSSGAAHGIATPLTLSSTLTVSNASALSLSGAIGGSAGLTKTGAGVLTVSGAGTYAGGTIVSGGTLLVNGTIAGPVTVGSGGTLGGTGTIGGVVTVNAGGKLAPGAGPGQINTGSLTLSGALAVEIQGTTPATQYDSTNVSGTVTLAGGSLVLSGAYVPIAGDTFTIISNDGVDPIAGTFGGMPEGTTFAFNGGTLQISYAGGTGNDVVLTAVALASTTWNGAGADPNWTTGANWVGGIAPASASSVFVTFGAASARFGARVDVPWTLNRMDIAGTTAYTIFGSPITFAGAAPQLNSLDAVHSISNDLILLSTAPLAFTNAVDLTYAGQMTGASGLIKAGAGRLAMTNVAGFLGFSGPITINGGTLQIGNGATGPPSLTMPIVDNATLELAGSGVPSVALPFGLTGTGNFVVSGGRADAFSTPLTHAGSTTVSGSAILVGNVTNNGALVIGSAARMDAVDVTVGSLAGAGLLNIIGTGVTVGGDGTSTTFSGPISGGGVFVMAAPGTLALTNLNPFAGFFGTVTISGGTLQIGDGVTGPPAIPIPIVDNGTLEIAGSGVPSVALPSGLTGTGNFLVSGGRADAFATPLTHAGSTTITGSAIFAGTVTNNGPLVIGAGARMDAFDCTVGSLAGAGLLNINGAGFTVGGDGTSTTYSGTISLGGAFVLVGPGRLALTNLNPFAGFFGSVTLNGGTLQIGNGVTGPTAIPMTIVDNGTLEFAGSGIPSVAVPGLTGTGNLVVSGGRVDAFGPPLTHAGSTTVTGTGFLAGTVTNNGPLVIDAGARMDAFDTTVGSLAGAGQLNVFGGGITVGGDGTNTTFSGPITGGNFAKTGAGTLTLSGSSFGTVSINGGTLLLTGSMTGSVAVNAGATFGGTGTVIGNVAVNAGGTLAPGLSPGIINTGNLTVSGAMLVEIQGTTLGTQYDNTNVTGTVTIAGGTLSLTGAYVPLTGDVFTIVTNDAADAVTGTFTGLPEGAPLVFNGSTLRISYVGGTGNDITLTAISTTTVVWNGAGANNNWSTGANWVVGFAPLTGATTFVTFPAASARFGPVVDAVWTINRMDVTGASAYAISGQAITFAGATPQLNSSGAAHTIANPLTLSTALTVSNASALTLSGAIGGAFSLTKTGAGTLLVTGSVAGPVIVVGGTLGGTGVIAGPVTVQAGATLSPGLSPGIINTGNLNLAGVALIEITGATLGTQYDNINVTGTVTIAGATLTLTGAYVPATGNTFTIITNDGADPVVGTFAGLPEGATVTINGKAMAISYVGGTGNDVVLALAPAAIAAGSIPTLSQWALILLAALVAAFGLWHLRRHASNIGRSA